MQPTRALPFSVTVLINVAGTAFVKHCKIPICSDMMMLVLCVLYIDAAVSATNHCVATTVLPASIKQHVLSVSNGHTSSLAPEWLVLPTIPSTAAFVMHWLTHADLQAQLCCVGWCHSLHLEAHLGVQ